MVKLKPSDVKVVPKEEAPWHRVKENAEKAIENSYIEIEINKAILKLAESKLVE